MGSAAITWLRTSWADDADKNQCDDSPAGAAIGGVDDSQSALSYNLKWKHFIFPNIILSCSLASSSVGVVVVFVAVAGPSSKTFCVFSNGFLS